MKFILVGYIRDVFMWKNKLSDIPFEVWKRHADTWKSLEIDAHFAYVYSYVGAQQTTPFLAAIRFIHLFIYSPVLRISYNARCININTDGIRVQWRRGARLKLLWEKNHSVLYKCHIQATRLPPETRAHPY